TALVRRADIGRLADRRGSGTVGRGPGRAAAARNTGGGGGRAHGRGSRRSHPRSLTPIDKQRHREARSSARGTLRPCRPPGTSTAVRGWTPDGRILFVSDAGQPFAGQTYAHTIDPGGGQPERLPWGPVMYLSYGADGGIAIGRGTPDPALWKRYRGGRAGTV